MYIRKWLQIVSHPYDATTMDATTVQKAHEVPLHEHRLNYTAHVAKGKWTEMQNKAFIHRQNCSFAGVCKTQPKALTHPKCMMPGCCRMCCCGAWVLELERITKTLAYWRSHSYRLMQLHNFFYFMCLVMSTFVLGATENRPYMNSFLKKIRWCGLCTCTDQLKYTGVYQAHSISLSLYLPSYWFSLFLIVRL